MNDTARELLSFLREELDGELRSLVRYSPDDYELVYVREDVREAYTDGEIEAAIADQRLETVTRAQQESLFHHGTLECTVRCFEGGIEMNFGRGEGLGFAVALDPGAFSDQRTFLGRCRDILDA